ncbi:MAG: hypothetical protein K2Y32_02810 [Candidatus Obscuribacterales bacterium]|nr:hypothetical protein [Candidatus Obscuribacterales bacterium]
MTKIYLQEKNFSEEILQEKNLETNHIKAPFSLSALVSFICSADLVSLVGLPRLVDLFALLGLVCILSCAPSQAKAKDKIQIDFKYPISQGSVYLCLPDSKYIDKQTPGIKSGELKGLVTFHSDGSYGVKTSDFLPDISSLKLLPHELITFLTVDGAAIDDSTADIIAGFKKLRRLSIEGTDLSDKSVVLFVKAMPDLEWLSLGHTKIDGSCLPYLKTLKHLKGLRLDGNQLKPQFIAEISKCPQLMTLEIERCKLTDAHLKEIANAKSIRTLFISDNQSITDRSAPYLRTMPNLKELRLHGTKFTKDGVLSLKPLKLIYVKIDPSLADGKDGAEIKAKLSPTRVTTYTETKNAFSIYKELVE